MTAAVLSALAVTQDFPAETVDPGFLYTVTGTLADGTPFSSALTSGSFDLAPGTYTGTVSKLGISSLESDPLVVPTGGMVTLQVPDATQKATLVLA